MTETPIHRRLAAILAADVVGYSRLMGDDEAGTLGRLRALHDEILEPAITQRHGRIVKLMGDGLLAEFSSAVEAVQCATDIQHRVDESEHEEPDDRRIHLRIGVNLGDIIVEGADIFGDGVNVAARLESLASPGGICISGKVHDEVRNKLAAAFEDLGEQSLKNISQPVRVYRWLASSTTSTATAGSGKREPAHSPPDKPSIAVLPFTNMSGDPEQDYFSDGISEDLITQLSKFRALFVTARNSSFRFKGEQVDIKAASQALGVQYIVEGSVRRAGNRVRITAQLVEASTENQVWAERFDRELDDLFEVQDEVTRAIVAVLPGRVQEDVVERAARKPTENMKAYEFMLQGKAYRDLLSAEGNARVRECCEQAIALDPRYARAYMYLSDSYIVDRWLGLLAPEDAGLALKLARQAVSLDGNDVYIQDHLGFGYLSEGMWDEAETQIEKTLSKIVNEAESMAWCGYALLLLDHQEKARDIVVKAMALDPMHPPALDWVLGQVCYLEGRYEEAVQRLVGEGLLNSLAHAFLTAAYAQLGREDEARAALDAFVAERHREFSSRQIAIEEDNCTALVSAYRVMWRNPAHWEQLVDGLRKAGLPG